MAITCGLICLFNEIDVVAIVVVEEFFIVSRNDVTYVG